MTTPREFLKDYVASGKLMQIATVDGRGKPEVCSVWYDAHFGPDVLRFISRHDRNHSINIRTNGQIAGAIVAIQLEGLGQTVRGVTFKGRGRELPQLGIDTAIHSFVSRWPTAQAAIDPARLASGTTPVRLYEVVVEEWVLFDEANFPDQPKQALRAGPETRITDSAM